MADQDAQDINQMMSASADAVVTPPKKSKFIWVVLGCVVVGVGLGVVAYQQSIKPAPTVKTTPRPSTAAVVTPVPSAAPVNPVPSATTPSTNVVMPLANTITFPEAGKVRVFSDLNNVTMVLTLTIAGQTRTITLPNRPVTSTTLMNYTDSTFEVTAGSTGTLVAHLNSTSGPKMGGWILPTSANKCGANGAGIADMTARIAYAQANVPSGKTLFAKQCWADEIEEGDPSSYDFNDFFLVWSYAGTTGASPSPSGSTSPSTSPSPSPSPSPSASPSPSPSSAASLSPSPSPSVRAAMPDTSGGTPVTGVFEVTVGAVSIGLLLLLLGLFGLLAL